MAKGYVFRHNSGSCFEKSRSRLDRHPTLDTIGWEIGIWEKLVVSISVVFHTSCVKQHHSKTLIVDRHIGGNNNSDKISGRATEDKAKDAPGSVESFVQDGVPPVLLRYTRVQHCFRQLSKYPSSSKAIPSTPDQRKLKMPDMVQC